MYTDDFLTELEQRIEHGLHVTRQLLRLVTALLMTAAALAALGLALL